MGPGRHIAERLASEEGGFTLVELLVVIIIAIVTTLALFAFQDLALRQSTRVFAKVDATQEARQAIERIETRLHSACVAEEVTPIQAGSTTKSLNFISKFGSAASVTPELHKIALSGTTLTDATYPVSGGTSPNWTFSGTASSTVKLLTNVSTASGSSGIFTYYKYGPAQDSSGNPYVDAAGNPFYVLLDGTSTLPSGLKTSGGVSVPAGTLPANSVPIASASQTGGLTSQDAQDTAAVGMKLYVGADGGLGTNPISGAPLTVSDTVVLRITPVPSDNNQGVPAPCE